MPIIVLQHDSVAHAGRLGRVLRDHGVVLDVRRLDLPAGGDAQNCHVPTDFDDVDGVIALGGHMNVEDGLSWMAPEMAFLAEAHKRKLPLVGICLGAQLIAKALGGEVGTMEGGPEWGLLDVKQHPTANTETIMAGVPWTHRQFHAHGQEVKTLPPGAAVLQYSARCKVQSYRVGMRTFGFQYHPEVEWGMMDEFVRCEQCARSWGAPAEVMKEAQQHFATYDRVSERLCENLATFVFPATRANRRERVLLKS